MVCGFGPDEGAGSVVPAVDEGPDLGGEVFDGCEGSPVDGLLLDDAEPNLDQVQPRTERRREVDMDTWICGKPVADFDRLVRNIFCVRSSAWIWDFSSTHNTIAFSGGAKYRPTTSVTFAISSGSVENLNVSPTATAGFHKHAMPWRPSSYQSPAWMPTTATTNAQEQEDEP